MLINVLLVIFSFVGSILARPIYQRKSHALEYFCEMDAYSSRDYGVFNIPLMMLATLLLLKFYQN
jgi:uncharacterized membrane protein